MVNTQDLADNVAAFARRNFPGQTPPSAATKIADEAAELWANPTDLAEAADVLITLMSWLAATGRTLHELTDAADMKMVRNWRRTWVKQPSGTYQHAGGN